MELKVLVDNNTIIDRYFLGEPAVSFLIRDDETKILFDVGYSEIFIKNALQMNESLRDINYVVLSHGHNDHTGGLVPLARFYAEAKAENINYIDPTIIAHPDTFSYKEYDGSDIGSMLDGNKVGKYFTTRLVREPMWITDNIVFLGEIARGNDFENTDPIGKCEKSDVMIDDYVKDDSAIVYKSHQGLVVITGCSHAGICNIIEYAKKVCGENRIADVIGGFHLIAPGKTQVEGTLKYFEAQHIKNIHPCHCTGLKYKIQLSKSTNVIDVGVGLSLHYQ
ncbi:MBL fold metallo-hydrolase [Desulforhopalus vacuolatus]|uniref:MBL fold metallo-hydrolase n=1 Tax=Desulforhopalus vacuolatus TaxID=40414 RepID=UPI0019645B2B|nr:MBL fold metallo-hydrolase [Desulforhopalus vacuolatus]MBM9518300.1 MBL fold metallo-hydrolase [Desulforhopalus vacuolatus]